MTTQVIFKMDSKLKYQGMKKAQLEGVPFSTIVRMLIKAYVQGDFEVGLVEKPNAQTARMIKQAHNDFSNGKNISGPYTTPKEISSHLGKLMKLK